MTPITTAQGKSLFMAMELSKKNWKLMLSDGKRFREVNVPANAQEGLIDQLARAKQRFELASDCPVWSCYEAGREGFWLHRCLSALGIKNLIVDPASIEVDRRKRRLKTDRIDARKLVTMLMRYHLNAEHALWRIVVVPSEEEEDARRVHREMERLKKERTGHLSRLRSLLFLHGITPVSMAKLRVDHLRDWQGKPLSPALRAEVLREQERLALVNEQLKSLKHVQVQAIREPTDKGERVAAKLIAFKGIGVSSAWVLGKEFFGWRDFKNRRQVGAMAGLVGTPYESGQLRIEQGISKAGSVRVRYQTIEMAWRWLWYQPQSDLSLWYMNRFGAGSRRMRRVGIVALARKLLVALWKYLQWGEIPGGAIMAG